MQFESEIGQPGTQVPPPVYQSRLTPRAGRSPQAQLFDAVVSAAVSAHRQGLPVEAATVARQNPALVGRAVNDILAGSKFRRALEDRGIDLLRVGGLDARQTYFLMLLTDPSVRGDNAKRLRMAQVTEREFQGWMGEDAFAKRFAELGGAALKAMVPSAKVRVAQGMDAGKLDFIKFGMELTGDYDPRGGPSVDVMAFGRVMLDVVAAEVMTLEKGVPASEVMRRIGAKMTLVTQGRRPDELDDMPVLEATVVEDPPTERGYNSDHENARGAAGAA